jgi:hypothetical protein
MFKDRRHTYGFRFNYYEPKIVRAIEQICRELYGVSSYAQNSPWSSQFGFARGTGSRPYWITVSDESYVSMILLKMDYVA